MIYYTLYERTGKIILPSNGLVLVRKLWEGLVMANSIDKNMGGGKYVSIICRPNQGWVSIGITDYTENHLTCLQQQANIVDWWITLFSKKQYHFSNRFLRTLTEFGLHTTRGLNKGMGPPASYSMCARCSD